MSAGARIAAFAVNVLAAFAAGYGAGDVAGPIDVGADEAPAHSGADHDG